MTDQPKAILIQSDLRPTYYDQFHCLAADCHYTCCKGWGIWFDKKDYLRLKHLKCSPALDANLKKCLHRVKKGPPTEVGYYGEFNLAGGYCPMMREDGLCSLQLEQGLDALTTVCKEFPRVKTYPPSGYLERSLSTGCEAVLELLWNLPEGIDFVSDPLPEKEYGIAPFHDPAGLRVHFQDIRSRCIDILQDRRYPLPRRILLMGFALKELADGERDIPRWLTRTCALTNDPETAQTLAGLNAKDGLPLFVSNNACLLSRVCSPGSDFAEVPKELSQALGFQHRMAKRAVIPTAPYLAAQARYEQRFADRAYFMENLMVALFFQIHLPELGSGEELWKSYVHFCNLYSFFRFLSVLSCRVGVEDNKAELFRLMLYASRGLLHNTSRQVEFRDEYFENNSATLAHMAILLGG